VTVPRTMMFSANHPTATRAQTSSSTQGSIALPGHNTAAGSEPIREVLAHNGSQYDDGMSRNLFEELHIQTPIDVAASQTRPMTRLQIRDAIRQARVTVPRPTRGPMACMHASSSYRSI
jgi:hypothetical protein